MPSDVDESVSPFDEFAERSASVFSRAPFFVFCVVVLLLWAPSYFLIRDGDEWQMIVHTVTTIITFLMVAILQNSEWRANAAVQGKLNAIAGALAELMDAETDEHPRLREAVEELRQGVGLEKVESS
ncbi:MAG: low affinity iron permease family protein [Nocardioidaceae bacterium]|nr:low affinity iron permease family protein [Nocardioidaceae bacterium]